MSKSDKQANWAGGVDNLAPANRTPDGFVRQAVNVDATPGGALHLRTGYERVYTGTGVRGALALGDKLLIADGTSLVELDTRNAETRVLRSIAGAGQFVGDVLAGVLYFCTANEALEYDGQRVRTWGVPDVFQQPLPSVSTGGALPAGQYKLAVTYTVDGREGGTDAPLQFNVPANGQLSVTLPTPPDDGTVNLYVSAPNGLSLYLQAAQPVGGSVTLTSLRDDTRLLTNAYLHAPLVGTRVRACRGQLAIADGDTVWLTAPLRPHLVDRRSGFFRFPAPVGEVMCDNNGYLFVSSDRCYAIHGVATDSPEQISVLEVPALAGSAVQLSDGSVAWMTPYGQAISTDSGDMQLVNRPHYAPALAESGAATLFDHNGNQLIITTQHGAQGSSPLAATDQVTGEVVSP